MNIETKTTPKTIKNGCYIISLIPKKPIRSKVRKFLDDLGEPLAQSIDWGKGLSPIGPDRKNQPRNYLLYFICSDD